MDKTTRSLLALLGTPDTSLRVAAMRVVAALEMQGKPVVEALAASLDADEEAVQVQALRALAQLGPRDAIHLVAPKILASGAVRQHAIQLLILAGPASVPELRKLYAGADFHGRRAIATALGSIGGLPVFRLLLGAMPSEDLEMIKHLTGCARQVLEASPATDRLAAARELRGFLRDPRTLRNPHAMIAGLILLGGFSDPQAVEAAQTLLLGYLDRRQPEPVRRNAAVSLGRLPVPASRAAALLAKLSPFLAEPEWTPVVQNVLPIVERLELQPAAVSRLVPLLEASPHVAVRAHVLERLRGRDEPAVAAAIVPCLDSQHPRLREAAATALKSMPSAAETLLDAWLRGRDAGAARSLEAILRAYPEPVRARCAARAAERLLALHEKNDARWQIYLDFVRSTDAVALQKRVAARLKTLRGSRAARSREKLEALLQLLWDQNLTTPEQRYEYALLLLCRSRKDVGREARAADPALRILGGLARQGGAGFVEALVGERDLEPDDYYYVGFHLSESGEELRPLGRALLAHVVGRWPRHKLRRAAQHKLEIQPPGPAAGVEPRPGARR